MFVLVCKAVSILWCNQASIMDLFHKPYFMLAIAINRAKHVCATVILKQNYMIRAIKRST